ncbi:MAG: ATP-binding protein [Elusimicrobia bacterium]|nr:ATP-binding protein [Elusimicrobiota bacterium]
MPEASPSFLFSAMKLSDPLVRDLRRMNPWWEGLPSKPQPETRRHLVRSIQKRLNAKVAPIVVVRGPRQIGKTTAQMQVLEDLLSSGVEPRRILRVQTDELVEIEKLSEPILRIVDWFETSILGMSLNEAAKVGRPATIFLDEVQNLKDWAPQLKHLVDNSAVQILVTGSSALRIGLGRDSLAGRISTIEAGVLSLTEIGLFQGLGALEPGLRDNGLEPLVEHGFWHSLLESGRKNSEFRDNAFRAFSERGGYPFGHERRELPWAQVADHLNETVIKRVIEHDLRVGERGRKRDQSLLEELFRMACRYVGQTPGYALFARETKRSLDANIGSQRVRQYLRFLSDTLLIRLVEPLEIRLKQRRGNSKICLADHGLRASWLQEIIPLDPRELEKNPHLTTLAGHLAESAVGALLATIPALDLAHLPARGDDPEVDFILTVGTRRIPLEVKYQRRIDPLADTEGLRAFIEKKVNNAPFGLLICQTEVSEVIDPRIVTIPLSSFMLLR